MYRVHDSQQAWFEGVSSLLRKDNPVGAKLKPSDFAVYVAVLDRINWRSSPRCEYTLAAIAREIGMDPSTVTNAVSRLKKAHVLAVGKDPRSGERYILVNPTYVTSGDPRRHRVAEKEWVALWKIDHPDPEMDEAEADHERIQRHNRGVDARARFAVA